MAGKVVSQSIPVLADTSFHGNILPGQDARYDVGSATKRWRRIYVKELNVSQVSGITITVEDADTVDGLHAASTPEAGKLLALNGSSAFPTSTYPEAILRDGTRPLTSDWDAGSNTITATGLSINGNIIVTGTVDGVDVAAHASRHESGGADTVDHDSLVNFVGDEHIDHTGVTLTAGDGLQGGGTIAASRTFNIDVSDFAIAANRLGDDGSENIYVYGLRQSDNGDDALVADAAGDMTAYGGITFDTQETIATNANNLVIAPAGDLVFNPGGDDVIPQTGYDINLGSLEYKFLTIHAAELWVETLVAQDTIATIGGRILVGPTTILASNLNATNNMLNYGFETAGGGGSDVFADWSEVWSDGSIVDETSIVRSGSHACKLVAGPTLDTRVIQDFSVNAGDAYTLRFFTRGDGTYAGRYHVRDLTNSVNIIEIISTGVTGTSYTGVYDAFLIPATCTSIRIGFWSPTTNGATAYFDDIYLWNSTIEVEDNEMSPDSDADGGKADWDNDGDFVYMESGGKVEFFYVLSGPTGSGPYTYGTARNLDGSGANSWYAGDAVFNTGTSGEGFIDIYSVHGVKAGTEYGPTIVGNLRGTIDDVEEDYDYWTEAWAIGNLNGIYGYSTTTMGIGLGLYSEADYMTIDPSNGIRFFDSGNTVQAQLSSGAWTLGEVAASKSNIYITAGSLSLRNNLTSRIGLTSAGVLTINDSAGSAVITLDASAGAEITKKLTMPGANSAIAIGSTPPTGPSTGTGIWIDRNGFYSVVSGTNHIKIDTADGALYAGNNHVKINSDGITLAQGSWPRYSLNTGALPGDGQQGSSLYGVDSGSSPTHHTVILWVRDDETLPSVTSTQFEISTGATALTIFKHDSGANTTLFTVARDGKVYINEVGNTKQTLGLTVNQGGADDEILSLKSSDINHTATTLTENDTYGYMQKASGTQGCLLIRGITEGVYAAALSGLATTATTTKSTGATAAVLLTGQKIVAGTVGDLEADANLVAILNNSTTKFLFDSDGDFWFTGTLQSYKNSTTYDVVGAKYLTTPLTSTSWDGDAYSTSGPTQIDLSSVFSVPAGVKAVLVQIAGRDNGKGSGKLEVGPTSSNYDTVRVRSVAGDPSSTTGDNTAWCPCDGGDIYYNIVASNQLECTIKIWGYAI